MRVSSVEEIKQMATPLFEQYKIKKAALFGSFARNEYTSESDIDLLVEFLAEQYSLLDIIGLKLDLEEILGRKVDLLTFRSLLDEEFDREVRKEANIIYEKN